MFFTKHRQNSASRWKKKRTKRKKENALLYHFKRKRRKEGKSDADERALLFIGVGYLANGYALHS